LTVASNDRVGVNELRYFGASAVAALVPSGSLFLIALILHAAEGLWGIGDDLDDASMRVVTIGMVTSGFVFAIYFVLLYLSARILEWGRLLCYRNLKQCKTCPECSPYKKGTIGRTRLDTTHTHFPIMGPHLHLRQVNQRSSDCKCFWNDAKPDVAVPSPSLDWGD
jgi:hypothetical protein